MADTVLNVIWRATPYVLPVIAYIAGIASTPISACITDSLNARKARRDRLKAFSTLHNDCGIESVFKRMRDHLSTHKYCRTAYISSYSDGCDPEDDTLTYYREDHSNVTEQMKILESYDFVREESETYSVGSEFHKITKFRLTEEIVELVKS